MATESFKRKLTTMFSADVVGYSRLMAEDEAETVKTLKVYREIMTGLIKQHRGRVVDSPGDNVLAEFTSVVDGVQCAVAVQKELQARNAQLPETRRMEFRIGINLGDVIEEEDRIYGDGVNIAARLEALAEPGGICISKTAFDHIETKLPLGYEYLGEQSVKNIPKPVGAYRVLMEPRVTIAGKAEKEKPGVLRRKPFLVGAAAVLVLAVGVGIWQFYLGRPSVEPASVEKMAYPLPDKPSLAVLPFDNLSGDKDQDYIADGLTENIIDALSRIPEMFVVARHSTLTYKRKQVKIRQIAEDLGVQYVLEGSVQKSGERLRVTTQLIDALKGHRVWSEKYDRKLAELFALQDDITLNIAIAMELKLTEGEQARMRHSTDNLEAWSLASKAKGLFEIYRLDDNSKARELFKKAVELDPNYAYAWVFLAWTHFMDGYWFSSHYDQKESFKQATEIAQKALSIDDTLSDAYALLSFVYLTQRKFDETLMAGKKAITLGPNDSENHAVVAIVMQYLGDGEAVINLIKKAMRLDPYFPGWYWYRLGVGYRLLGRYEEAVELQEWRRKEMEKENRPNFITYMALATTYAMMGRMEEARVSVSRVLELNPKISIESWRKHQLYKDPEYTERILEALRKAGLPETPPLPLPDKPSIAVLPFTNMSGDPKQEYFSDGITEEIITALSKTPKLFVIARHSTFTYKGKPVKVKQIGRELGVQYVLEGSVRKAAERVRITAQLIDATTEKHLWAERYDRDLKDLFALQDEITMKIITALRVKLTEGEQARLIGKGTDNLEAYLKCLQARELNEGAIAKEKCVLARWLLEEAIALDPKYSEAYAVLAQTHSIEVWLGMSKSPREHLKHGVELAQKAIALANSNAHAHSILAALYVMLRQHDKGLAAIERAYALEPNSPDVLFRYGNILYRVGKWEEAVRFYEEAMRLNPIPPNMYLRYYGGALRELERYDEAIAVLKKAIQQEPKSMFAHLMLATAYSLAGREEEAREEAKEVLRINPRFSVRHLEKTLAFKNPAHTQRLIDAMRKAGLPD